MDTVLNAITKAKDFLATIRKAIPPAIAAAYVIFGTDASTIGDIVSVLVALGVYAVPNRKPRYTFVPGKN